jgi:cathepsin L
VASYAFAAVASLEYVKWISTGFIEPLSPQQIIDCSTDSGNNGCVSGLPTNSFSYLINKGITSEKKYKYNQVKGDCTYSPLDKVWEVVKCSKVTPNNDKALESSVLAQPTAVMIDGT